MEVKTAMEERQSVFVPMIIDGKRLDWCIDQLQQRSQKPSDSNLRALLEDMIDAKIEICPHGSSCVYELCYPESMGGQPFYIGQGSEDRYKQHAAEARRGVKSAKCDVIRSIWERGEQMVVKVVKEGLSSGEAMNLEKERIHEIGYENLVNVPPRGKDRSYKGPAKGPVYYV